MLGLYRPDGTARKGAATLSGEGPPQPRRGLFVLSGPRRQRRGCRHRGALAAADRAIGVLRAAPARPRSAADPSCRRRPGRRCRCPCGRPRRAGARDHAGTTRGRGARARRACLPRRRTGRAAPRMGGAAVRGHLADGGDGRAARRAVHAVQRRDGSVRPDRSGACGTAGHLADTDRHARRSRSPRVRSSRPTRSPIGSPSSGTHARTSSSTAASSPSAAASSTSSPARRDAPSVSSTSATRSSRSASSSPRRSSPPRRSSASRPLPSAS